MAKPTAKDVRETLLTLIDQQRPKSPTDQELQTANIIGGLRERFGGDLVLERVAMAEWHELVRTGYVAWGYDFDHPDPPNFHVTERGHRALALVARDPGNPAGYLRHLDSVAKINPVARSYLVEALDCFVAGLYKAAAVLLGAAAESLVLELRDAVVRKLDSLRQPAPKDLANWKAKAVLNALYRFFEPKKPQFDKQLREEFEAYWLAFAQPIRAARNDAGHPVSVDPVTPDTVHAGFLLFPELARLTTALLKWTQ